MTNQGLWTVLGLVFACSACSGDDGERDSSATGSLSGFGEDDDGPFNSCQNYDFRPAPAVPPPTGSAHLSVPASGDLPALELDLPEVTCETLHDAAGNAVGYGASFFSSWESTTFAEQYATIRWTGTFTGDGTYEDARFFHSEMGESTFSSRRMGAANGTLTLTEGGRVGSFVNQTGATPLTFACGNTSKISTAPKPPPAEVPPGTLRFSAASGPVYTFTGISCGTAASEDFEISSDFDSPYSIRILLNGNGTGTHNTDSFELEYAGLTAVSEGGRVNLTCGYPSRGTMEFGGVNNGVWNFQGAFHCPE